MSRYTDIVYIGRYLVLTLERFISTVCCFFSYIYWSVNCMSRVSIFKKNFLTCTDTEARFIFEGFITAVYGKFISDSPIIFFTFFYLVCKLFKGLFQPLCQLVNCMIESLNQITYLGYLQKVVFVVFVPSQTFFWSVNCENLICKLCVTFWKCQDTQALFILECIYY